jgi:hypothetical protein
MDDITQQLQELAKSRRITKLLYKQANQKKTSVIVNDSSVD